jgi:kynurenine 3-monooxygenase
MVTFTRMPYADALARGAAQERVLRALTTGRRRIEEIDLAAADALVRADIEPLAS